MEEHRENSGDRYLFNIQRTPLLVHDFFLKKKLYKTAQPMNVYSGLFLSLSEDKPDVHKLDESLLIPTIAFLKTNRIFTNLRAFCRFTAAAVSPSSLAHSEGFRHGQSKPAPPAKPTYLLFRYHLH